MKQDRIAFLSAPNSPFVGRTLAEFRRLDLDVVALVLDEGKPCGPKEAQIWEERTGGRLPPLPVHAVDGKPVPAYFVSSHMGDDCLALLAELDLDLLVSATTPRILRRPVLQAARRGVLAVHPGAIPAYRGCTCVEWAIANNDPVANSAFFMTEGIDAGPVVVSEAVAVAKTDKYLDVRVKCYRHGIGLIARAAKIVAERDLHADAMLLPGEGRYYPVIDATTMASVIERLDRGEYVHQRAED
jgi:methionyl-tRNA formyltransferase